MDQVNAVFPQELPPTDPMDIDSPPSTLQANIDAGDNATVPDGDFFSTSEVDPAIGNDIDEPREDTIATEFGETIYVTRIGVQPLPLSTQVFVAPKLEAEVLLFEKCRGIICKDRALANTAIAIFKKEGSAIPLSNTIPIKPTREIPEFTEAIFKRLWASLVRRDGHEHYGMISFSAYTGLPLSWSPGPLTLSIEAPYVLSNPERADQNDGCYLGYHSEPNVVLVEDCLNWAKGKWIPVVLPLIAALLRADLTKDPDQWKWLFNALTNAASYQRAIYGLGNHSQRLAWWAGLAKQEDAWGYAQEVLQGGRSLESPPFEQQIRNTHMPKHFHMVVSKPNHWRQTMWIKEGTKVPIITEEEQDLALYYLKLVAASYNITEDQFLSSFTILGPSGKPVFCPFSRVCWPLLQALGYRWEDLYLWAREGLSRMRENCNKYAEECGIGEPDLNELGLLLIMMHDLGNKYTRLRHSFTLETSILDSFGLPYVPFRGHPLSLAICKKGDHGIAMLSGLIRYPGQEGFNPVDHFNPKLCTLAFDSAFTNNLCRNYDPREWPEIRARASLVPLEHFLWRVPERIGIDIWGFREISSSTRRPAPIFTIQVPLASLRYWIHPRSYIMSSGLEPCKDMGYQLYRLRRNESARGTPTSGPFFDYKSPELFTADQLKIFEDYWRNPSALNLHLTRTRDLSLRAFDLFAKQVLCPFESCNRRFWSRYAQEIHIQQDHYHLQGGLICQQCGARFFLRIQLRFHITWSCIILKCPHDSCNYEGTQWNMANHERGVHGKKVQCPHNGCNYEGTQQNLAYHERGVHGEKVYSEIVQCPHDGCNYEGTQQNLAHHKRRVHGKKVYSEIIQCPYDGCNYEGIQQNLAQHERGVHGKKVQCPHDGCNYEGTQQNLANHERGAHGEKFQCRHDGCDYEGTQLKMADHERGAHGEKFQCCHDGCDYEGTKRNMVYHERGVHGKKVQCPHNGCNYEGTQQNLAYHERGVHGEKVYSEIVQCPYDGCNYEGTQQNLAQHERVHGKKVQCPHDGCNYKGTEQNIARHKRGVHGKRFQCPYNGCSYKGTQLGLIRHKQSMHRK